MRALALSLFATLLVGCAGSMSVSTARTVVQKSAEAVDASDVALTAGYTRAAEDALQSTESYEDYLRVMAPWDRAVDGLLAARAAVLAAEQAIDAWVAGKSSGVGETLACLAGAMAVLLDNLGRIDGLTVPDGVKIAVNLLDAFAGTCHSVEG